MSRRSTFAVSTLTPALKVLSTTLPERTFLSLVRTKAGPLPGLTCWNSTTDQSWPSRLRTKPFLRSLVDATCQSLSMSRYCALRRRARVLRKCSGWESPDSLTVRAGVPRIAAGAHRRGRAPRADLGLRHERHGVPTPRRQRTDGQRGRHRLQRVRPTRRPAGTRRPA